MRGCARIACCTHGGDILDRSLPNKKAAPMNRTLSLLLGVAALLTAVHAPVSAQVRVTEVAPWASGNAPYATDWFELTNIGASAVTVTGWKMDDNSASFASAVALNGISSIAPGQSVIFLEPASLDSGFVNAWFAGAPPAGLQIGTYSGNGVGLSTSGDAVNVYDAGGTLTAGVSFGASDAVAPFQTFDNAAGLNNTTISLLSVSGVNGAFVAQADANEIGSPGLVSAVPEPSEAALLLVGLGVLGAFGRQRRR